MDALQQDCRRWLGIDIGSELSSICVIDQLSKVVREAEVPTSLDAIHGYVTSEGNETVELIAVEASSLSPILVRGLRSLGLPVAMFDSRQTRKFLRIRQNKTDRNDARGLAEVGLHGRNSVSEVRLKSMACQKVRSMLAIRQHLVRQRIASEAVIRSIIRLNGSKLQKSTSAKMLRQNVTMALSNIKRLDGSDLSDVIEPMLQICEHLRREQARIDRDLTGISQGLEVCRRFMEISGIGPIGSLSFYSAVEEPTRFKRSEDIGPYLGMVPRIKQSGPIVRRFGISRTGNKMTRHHLMTAASIHLRRAPDSAAVRVWGEKLRERLPSQKVRIAMARKLAIIMLAMWKNGSTYRAEGLAPAH